jgi:polyisoprenoid-binding protein YceI
MKRILTSVFLMVALVAAAHAEPWLVDKTHSLVGFTVKHMMVSNVHGEFGSYEATVDFDPANPTALSLEATMDVNSVSTRDTSRDKHLRSADFFDVANHPTLTFKSKKVTKIADGHLQVSGDLTIRGVTKPITLDVMGLNKVWTDPWGAQRTGCTASAVINRKDFGLMWNKALEAGGVLVGDEVNINLEIELMQKKS